MRFMGVVAVLAGALAACSPGETGKYDPHAASAPTPPPAAAETFGANCTWGEVKGAQLTIWSYACGPESSGIHLEADDTLPGFRLVGNFPERPAVIRVFDKPAGAPVDAILPAVRELSPGPATAACAFAPATGVDHEGKAHVVLTPTSADRVAYDAAAASDTVPENPCGDLGIGPAGDRYFVELAPDKVAFIDAGSEIQIFDVATLKVVPADADAHAAPAH